MNISTTTSIIIVLSVVVLGIYISYYYRYPADVSIVQTSLANFSMQIFMEKQPIVVQDRVQNLTDIRKAWFGTNITFNDVLKNDGQAEWVRNRFKFLVLQPQEKTEIVLYPPHLKMVDGAPDPEEHLLVMKVDALQILILPLHWKYHIETKNIISIGVHDFITPFLF